MRFGGFTAKIGISGGGGSGGEMLADGLFSYNIMSSTRVLSVPPQSVHSSVAQPLFTSSPLSLALVYSYVSRSLNALSANIFIFFFSRLFNCLLIFVLKQPRMENLGEMGMLGEGFDNSVLGRAREDEFDTRSGSENFEAGFGDNENNAGSNKSSKMKKCH